MKPSSLALWLVATLISSPLLAADLQFVDEPPLTTTPKRWLEQRLGVLLAPDYDRASLLGHHYSFRQLVNGLPVAATQAAVSVDGDGRPWRLYHNLRPLQSTAPGCDASGTLDPLLATLRTDGNQIETLGPVEAWYWRDGDTLVPALRQRVREHKAGNAKASQVQLFARCDGEQELGRLGDQATTRPLHVADAGDQQVQARVFDPDPRTRLQDASLVWHDELVLAQAAYQDPVPPPVSLQAGQYRLSGPHARVVDVMAPESAPYSSSDVQGFRLTRDDRGFADINAYYHLDLAQRHLKALGFTELIPGALDDLRARYHPDYRYPAHRTINGSNGDQLWGTPLFQALLTAVAEHGEAARDEFDRVIIESHFGLGPAIRMPQLARITVDTAARLYPTRAYARLLEQAFRQHGLLQAPVNIALAEGSAIPLGQRQSVQLTLSNPGKGEVTLNELALTLPTGLQADPDSWQPATLAAGASMTTTLRLLAQSPLACGDEASLSVNLAMSSTSPTERQWQQSLTLPIGTPVISRASGRSQRLNDAQSEEVRGLSETSLLLEKSDARVSDRLQLSLDLQHEALDELEIWLSSPAGTRVQIWDKGYSSLPSLKGVFPTELLSLQPFSAFEGEPLAGRWTLEVVDSKPGNQGLLNGWSISQRTGAQCGNTVPVPDDGIIRFDTSDSSGGGTFSLLWLLPLALWRRLRHL